MEKDPFTFLLFPLSQLFDSGGEIDYISSDDNTDHKNWKSLEYSPLSSTNDVF